MGRFIAVLSVMLLSLASVSAVAQTPAARTITVNGQAEIRVVPDEVLITIGVETDNLDIAKARADNDARIKAITGAIGNHAIRAEHVRTEFLDLRPRYNDSYTRKSFLGYFARRSLTITLGDTSRFESLLSDILSAGANYIHGIEFRTTELRKHRDEARALALKAAREKAVAMASSLGTTAGAPVTIQDGYAGWWSPYSRWWGDRGGSWAVQNVVQDRGGATAAGDDAVVPGQISVTANVTVTFELGAPQR